MKNLLRASLAAAALVASAGAAQAQTITYNSEYSSLLGSVGYNLFGFGTVYRQGSVAGGNTGTVNPTATTTFTLKGNVDKDCSFYSGSSNAREISLGTIGIRGGSGENVSDAFDMTSDARASIRSGTAGCNFNNTVTISKQNGALGLRNAAAGGFDSDEFQANIPYRIETEFTGTENRSAGEAGTPQRPFVAANEGSKVWTGGAWRSSFDMDVFIYAPSKALVAGSYEDRITVTLAAS